MADDVHERVQSLAAYNVQLGWVSAESVADVDVVLYSTQTSTICFSPQYQEAGCANLGDDGPHGSMIRRSMAKLREQNNNQIWIPVLTEAPVEHGYCKLNGRYVENPLARVLNTNWMKKRLVMTKNECDARKGKFEAFTVE
jgi:hypothetical protein